MSPLSEDLMHDRYGNQEMHSSFAACLHSARLTFALGGCALVPPRGRYLEDVLVNGVEPGLHRKSSALSLLGPATWLSAQPGST